MEMEVITLSSSADFKVKNYACVCVCKSRCTNSVCLCVGVCTCKCVFCLQRHATKTNGQKSPKNGSSSKAGHCNLKFLFGSVLKCSFILEKAWGSKKNPVVPEVYSCYEESGLATTATGASWTAQKLAEAQPGLVSRSDSQGMIHSETSVKKRGICFSSQV